MHAVHVPRPNKGVRYKASYPVHGSSPSLGPPTRLGGRYSKAATGAASKGDLLASLALLHAEGADPQAGYLFSQHCSAKA